MTSSKKKRGKQRKAAKLAAAANNNISGDINPFGGDFGSEISGGHRTTEAFSDDLHLLDDRTDFIDCIRKGDGSATKILCNEEFADRAKAAAIRVSEGDGSDMWC